MTNDNPNPIATPDEEPHPIQSGSPDGFILHLGEEDNDFILDVLDQVIERLDRIEAALVRIHSVLSAPSASEGQP